MVTPLVTHPTPAENIKTMIREAGLTQSEVARRMGISDAQLSRLISGHRKWYGRTKRAFSLATGISGERLQKAMANGDA